MSMNPAADANETMAKLLALENRTGYTMQQFNGQRKFWNPKWDKPIPPRGCEVFVGKIPRNLFEDELVPVFEKIGQIYELRLMMDFSGYNRGYAFVCFTCREHAQLAISRLDNYEIRPGMRIGVCRSVDNCRLFVGGIPKDKTQLEIRQAMCEISEDVSDVIVYPGSEPGEQNRGFAFVEYRTHRAAAMARRKLIPGRITLFGNEIVTDWAEPEIDANESLNRIKNVYVRNLKISTTEQTVFAAFNVLRPGAIERVKKIEDRDYAFVHFLQREDALYAVQVMNGQKIDGQEVQVSLAKPPSNKHDANNTVLNLNQTNNFNQPPTMFGRINGVMMTRPTPATQSQSMLNQFSSPTATDFANIIRAQSAAKLQQSLRNLQPPPAVPSYLVQPPKLSPPTYPLLSGPKGDGLLGPISKSNDCGCNGKSVVTSPQQSKDLVPVSTLDHIAKIQCPVVYLDEISTMFNNGIRPVYALYTDNSQGLTRYVYRITFMGECYTPPADRYCYSVPDAQRSAAEYVLRQIDPWLKKKITEVVQNSCSTNSPAYPPASAPNPLPAAGFTAPSNTGLYNAASMWESAFANQKACNYESINRKPETQTSFKSLSSGMSSNLMGGLTSANTSASSSYGLSNSIWGQMKLADNYLTGNPYQKNSSPLMSESLSSLKRTTPTFDRVLSPCNALQVLSLDS